MMRQAHPIASVGLAHGKALHVNAAAATVPSEAHHLTRRRRVAIWALIVVAAIIGIGSILTTWVNRQVLDNEAWRNSSAELIADPAVQQTLSVYLVDQLYANVDVAGS